MKAEAKEREKPAVHDAVYGKLGEQYRVKGEDEIFGERVIRAQK